MPDGLWAFLAVVWLGTYIQTITGFAMGLIVMGAATYLNAAPIPITAAVLSLLALMNTVLALRERSHDIHRKYVLAIVSAQLPAMAFGLWWLHYLRQESVVTLRFLLGALIFLAGLALARKPEARGRPASLKVAATAGAIGGLFGGLFSTSGAPLAFFLFRQPLPLAVIRASLLAIFTLSATARTLMVGVSGGLTASVWQLTLFGTPVVLLGTWLGRRYPPPLSEKAMKRLAFVLLAVIGLSLMGQSIV